MTRVNWIIRATVLGLVIGMPTSGKTDYAFTKIADTNTPIPGGTGNFTEFDSGFSVGPAISGGNVAFTAAGPSGQRGIYFIGIGGMLTVVADTNTPIPGGTGNFTELGPTALASTGAAALGSGGDDYKGIFTFDLGGGINRVVNTDCPVPGGRGKFRDFTLFYSYDGRNVAFCGADAYGRLGIYTDIGGGLNVVANTNTPIPGGTGNFRSFDRFTKISNGSTVFLGFGSGNQAGIYTDIGGELHVVADTSTPIPGGTGNFTGFGSFSFSDGNIAFFGLGSGGQVGYYTNLGGILRVVADTNTAIPGGTGNFTGFGSFIGPALSRGNVAIAALGSSGQAGLYIEINGLLTKVIDHSEALDGKSFSNFAPYISPMALDGNQVAFEVLFNDLSEGIFVATLVP